MANSFKQMTKAGVIKRTDTGMFIALSDIHVREGFNKREDDERTRQADDDLFNYLMNGGSVPRWKLSPVMKVVCGLLKVTAAVAAMRAVLKLASQLTASTSCRSTVAMFSAWLAS
jgi:hypothetical protein